MLLEGSDKFWAAIMVWSPDSQQIAFLNTSGRVLCEAWIINHDGTDPHVVHSFERHWAEVVWSPDGRQIAYQFEDAGKLKAFLINADGSGEPQRMDKMPWSCPPDFWPQWGGEK